MLSDDNNHWDDDGDDRSCCSSSASTQKMSNVPLPQNSPILICMFNWALNRAELNCSLDVLWTHWKISNLWAAISPYVRLSGYEKHECVKALDRLFRQHQQDFKEVLGARLHLKDDDHNEDDDDRKPPAKRLRISCSTTEDNDTVAANQDRHAPPPPSAAAAAAVGREHTAATAVNDNTTTAARSLPVAVVAGQAVGHGGVAVADVPSDSTISLDSSDDGNSSTMANPNVFEQQDNVGDVAHLPNGHGNPRVEFVHDEPTNNEADIRYAVAANQARGARAATAAAAAAIGREHVAAIVNDNTTTAAAGLLPVAAGAGQPVGHGVAVGDFPSDGTFSFDSCAADGNSSTLAAHNPNVFEQQQDNVGDVAHLANGHGNPQVEVEHNEPSTEKEDTTASS